MRIFISLFLISALTICFCINTGLLAEELDKAEIAVKDKETQTVSRDLVVGADQRERGLMILGVPEPIAQGVHVNLGKAAEWVIDRSVKLRGWSFSGYSITTLDDNYGIRRWHFGIISGEMDIDAAKSLIDRGIDAGSEYHDEFEWRRSQGIILGVRYTRTF